MDWCTIFGAVVYGLDFVLLVLMYPFDSHSFFPVRSLQSFTTGIVSFLVAYITPYDELLISVDTIHFQTLT
jgi:hypothetical protein